MNKTKTHNIPKLRFTEFSDEWRSKKLGEVAKFSKGKGISKSEIVVEGKNDCIRYGELYTLYGETISEVHSKTNNELDKQVISEANDVIIPASGETQIDIATASCVLKDGIILGGDLNIIKTKNNGVFLSYYLNSKKKIDIARLSQGVSVIHLYSSQLSSLKLNFPQLPEQQKIASFLTAVDTKITQLTHKKELLAQYKKGVMQQIFNQELRFKDDKGNKYPKWKVKMLGDICEINKGKQLNAEFLTKKGLYPCISGGINPSGYTKDYNRIENTITISEGGNSCGFVNFFSTKFWCGGHCYAIENLKNDIVGNNFLYQILKYREIKIMRLRVGSGLPNIQKKDIHKFKIVIPNSIEEQTKIANFLASIDAKINQVAHQLEKTKTFKKGLLQQLFV